MSRAFASNKRAIAICDRCGFTYPLKQLRTEIVNLNKTNLLVCPECWDQDHPQNLLGRQDYSDPQALRNPRPDSVKGSDTDPNRFIESLQYNFDSDLDSWSGSAQSTVSWSSGNGGEALITTNGAVARIQRGPANVPLSFDAGTYKFTRILIRSIVETSPSDWDGRLSFRRSTDINYTNREVFAERPVFEQFGEKWHIITWKVSEHADWSGTITGLRIDPYNASGNQMGISYIRFESS